MPHFTRMIFFFHHIFQSTISKDMGHVSFTVTLCSGVLWSAARSLSKAIMATQPICNPDFFSPNTPCLGFVLLSAKRHFPKKPCMALTTQSTPARHQRHHPQHIPNTEHPMLELKGQSQFFPKCPTLVLTLLHLPTENQSP